MIRILFLVLVLAFDHSLQANIYHNPFRCEQSLLKKILLKPYVYVRSLLQRNLYIEDVMQLPENEILFVTKFMEKIKIGYDGSSIESIQAHAWHGMWSLFKNLRNVDYADHPRQYNLESKTSLMPHNNHYIRFALKSVHAKNQGVPLAYLVGWERREKKKVDWAVHVVFVSGGDFWITGKSFASQTTSLNLKKLQK